MLFSCLFDQHITFDEFLKVSSSGSSQQFCKILDKVFDVPFHSSDIYSLQENISIDKGYIFDEDTVFLINQAFIQDNINKISENSDMLLSLFYQSLSNNTNKNIQDILSFLFTRDLIGCNGFNSLLAFLSFKGKVIEYKSIFNLIFKLTVDKNYYTHLMKQSLYNAMIGSQHDMVVYLLDFLNFDWDSFNPNNIKMGFHLFKLDNNYFLTIWRKEVDTLYSVHVEQYMKENLNFFLMMDNRSDYKISCKNNVTNGSSPTCRLQCP